MWTKSAVGIVALAVLAGSVALITTARGSDHMVLSANLTGEKEVCVSASCNDPDGSGSAVVRLDPAGNQVCFTLRWDKIQAPYGAHIHRGRAGVEGPVKATLFSATKLSRSVKKIGGCVKGVDQALINNILDHPRHYYVNIHTPKFEGGAVRGQLHQ